MQYNFAWDPKKARTNRRQHGVSFEEAVTVFLDPRMVSVYDETHSEEEDRWITVGMSAMGRLLVVCHTFRDEADEPPALRIFSARMATKREGQDYER